MNYNTEISRIITKAISEANKRGYKLTLCFDTKELLDKDGNLYADSIWWGGEMFYLENKEKGISIDLRACGDVEAYVQDKLDNTIVVDMKDRNNMGYFRDEVDYYLHGDKELYDAEGGNHNKYNVEFQANNWFEGFVQTPIDDFFDVVDGNILEILNDISGLIEWAEQ